MSKLADLLLGKKKLPPGVEGLTGEEARALNEELARESVSAVAGTFAPAGTASPLGWVAKKTGLNQIPDRLMQKAVGLKKYMPGVGTKLVEEGVGGTKGQIQAQLKRKIGEQGKILDAAVSKIKTNVQSDDIAKAVGAMGDKFKTSTGIVPESVAREAGLISGTAADIAKRGAVTPKEALELKRIAQGVGYKQGEPLSKLASKIGQTEASGYGKALEQAFAKSVPDAPNAVSEANAKLSAFLKANKAVNKPESLASGILPDALTGGAGFALGGPAGSALAIAGRRAAKMPLVQSGAAHLLQRGVGPGIVTGSQAGLSRAALEASRIQPQAAEMYNPDDFEDFDTFVDDEFEVLD